MGLELEGHRADCADRPGCSSSRSSVEASKTSAEPRKAQSKGRAQEGNSASSGRTRQTPESG